MYRHLVNWLCILVLSACTTPTCEQWAEEMIRTHEEAGHLQTFVIVDPEGEAVVWLDMNGRAMITEGVVWEPDFAAHLERNGWEQTGECGMPPDHERKATTWRQRKPMPAEPVGEKASARTQEVK